MRWNIFQFQNLARKAKKVENAYIRAENAKKLAFAANATQIQQYNWFLLYAEYERLKKDCPRYKIILLVEKTLLPVLGVSVKEIYKRYMAFFIFAVSIPVQLTLAPYITLLANPFAKIATNFLIERILRANILATNIQFFFHSPYKNASVKECVEEAIDLPSFMLEGAAVAMLSFGYPSYLRSAIAHIAGGCVASVGMHFNSKAPTSRA